MFLLATILTFVLQKSSQVHIVHNICIIHQLQVLILWTMRNYIHCMLCGNMFTALACVYQWDLGELRMRYVEAVLVLSLLAFLQAVCSALLKSGSTVTW